MADPSVSPSRHRGRTRRSHGALYVLIACAVAVALVVGLGSLWFYRHLGDNLTSYNPEAQLHDRPDVIAPGDPINILVMGSDTREGEQSVEEMLDGGARSDTTILLHLSSDRKHAYGVSIPRDTIVDRPECKLPNGDSVPAESQVMFNTAFYYGGPACTQQTVESITGVRIQHSVVVNFAGFKDMVDAIGGVEVCIPHAIDDDQYNMHLKEGTQVIKGKEALTYVRVRHGFGNGSDIGRMKRQQAFIASMAAKVVSAGTLTRIDRLVKFLNAATKSLALDEGLANILKLAKLGNQFRQIGLDGIQFITVPWEVYPEDPNRIQFMEPKASKLWDRIRNDEPLSRRFSNDAISAANVPSSGPSSSPSGSPSSHPSSHPTTDAEAAAEAEANGLCS